MLLGSTWESATMLCMNYIKTIIVGKTERKMKMKKKENESIPDGKTEF